MEPWRVFLTTSAERVLKKLPPGVSSFVSDEFPPIVKQNPLCGGSLTGPLAWLRSYHFNVGGSPYRVAYEMKEKERKIVIHYVDYRGGFYDRLRRLLHV